MVANEPEILTGEAESPDMQLSFLTIARTTATAQGIERCAQTRRSP